MAKMKGEQDPEKYLTVDVRKVQLEVQEYEDEKEKKAHNARAIFDGVKNEKEKEWLENVRETHVNWDSSDGPCQQMPTNTRDGSLAFSNKERSVCWASKSR